MSALHDWIAGLYGELSYGHIFALMIMQASLFPVPAELVVLPAGYLARSGQLNPWLAWLSGLAGIFTGASFNYLLGRTVGRALVLKYGRYFLITEQKYHRAERAFLRNAFVALSICRMIPVINRALPLPAGVFKLGYWKFAGATLIGAGMQSAFWVSLGYFLGEAAIPFLKQYFAQLALCFLLLPALIILAMSWRRKRRARLAGLTPPLDPA
jgi:membrane protein DedA with SNARE-associated domain